MKEFLILMGGIKVGFLIMTVVSLVQIIRLRYTPTTPYILILISVLTFLAQQLRILIMAGHFAPIVDVTSLSLYTVVSLFLYIGFKQIADRFKALK